MENNLIFWICILVALIGVASLLGIYFFGQVILRNHVFKNLQPFRYWEEIFHRSMKDNSYRRENIPQHLAGAYSDYLERRNEFWTTFGQVIIAIVIVIILSILLLTKAISAEAGLPILSGISGFAIAKGVSGAKSVNIPNNNPNLE
ncbi:MAG: hypothetical protein JEY96_19370 [Bacteroidales bacterium]|nr:hypothetical protein [Bacteroidales bacterium]